MTTLLFTTGTADGLDGQLSRLRSLPTLPPFSPQARGFVAEFTRRILKLPGLRGFPELATLSHWFRPAAIDHLARQAATIESGTVLSRGTVFHLAPANVDVLFAYAWLMSLLAGNRNVARLSQKPGQQRDALIGILRQMQAEGLFPEVLERTVLLTYPHDDTITRAISAHCHARIVWGGDATVAKIRAVPLAAQAIEMVFPDRFGIAVFDSHSIAAQSGQELRELARRFCNDMLWFAQQACSSPRCLYWIGSPDAIAEAKASFWPAVRDQASQFEDETAALMARITDACLLATVAEGARLEDSLAAYPIRLSVDRAGGDLREIQSGYGLITEVDLARLDLLADQLDDRDQTMVAFGLDHAQLAAFASSLPNRALDRVVPVGRALDFHHIWDGTDLFAILMRRITLPRN
ncbi:hypothetical protein MNQ95_09725 [Pseudoxanthomonas daejeonensis]|uniref:acyl-CoA reductase n=1 Tax=Pseudoxanthomonas daejeonensis TaxID=266062 RepID=UPI001F5405D9|nr:acyl-CoA reductase [Pseudoxanthomonas daejeonensis]UNK56447.1 hypothetical protein MNQ95_09725 [Pseudoxanthomonas daejeonensis]